MSILLNEQSHIIVQGITGRYGSFLTRQMLEYGTRIAGGVTPGKGGDWFEGKPVFDTVRRAIDATGATISMVAVPAHAAADAIMEAAEAGIELIVCITEHIPLHDMLRTRTLLESYSIQLIGPNSPGILIPGKVTVGVIPPWITQPGSVGIVSSSSALLYETALALTRQNIGQSALVGIGSDSIIGMKFVDILELFDQDHNTEKIVIISEPGGYDALTEAASFIATRLTRPVVACIPGQSLDGTSEAPQYTTSRVAALANAGVRVAQHPEHIVALLTEI